MTPRFLAWETGCMKMVPFTGKEEEQQVSGAASLGEDEQVEFKICIRTVRGEVRHVNL